MAKFSKPLKDNTGRLHAQHVRSRLPKIYFIAHESKGASFLKYTDPVPVAANILDWVKENSNHNLSKINTQQLGKLNPDTNNYEAFGKRQVDNFDFF